jgi:hypothetical protein
MSLSLSRYIIFHEKIFSSTRLMVADVAGNRYRSVRAGGPVAVMAGCAAMDGAMSRFLYYAAAWLAGGPWIRS